MENYTILAHRGVTEYGYYDNSFQSLIEIKNINSDFKLGVEFDIQLTMDNKIVIYHDEYLDDISIEKSTYNDIIKKNSSIIQLDRILKEFDNTQYLLNIELKCYSISRLETYSNILIDLLSKYNLNYIISSFNLDILKLIKESNILNVYFISENVEYINADITIYNMYNKFNNIIGIYTLYDEDFNKNILLELLKTNINILITDNVEKLNNYLIKYLDKD